MTKEQFLNQNLNWKDKYYHYAIHKTDGGAVYLWQVDGALTSNNLNQMNVIRLDGVDLEKLAQNILKVKEI